MEVLHSVTIHLAAEFGLVRAREAPCTASGSATATARGDTICPEQDHLGRAAIQLLGKGPHLLYRIRKSNRIAYYKVHFRRSDKNHQVDPVRLVTDGQKLKVESRNKDEFDTTFCILHVVSAQQTLYDRGSMIA